jgi:hypothetical protein
MQAGIAHCKRSGSDRFDLLEASLVHVNAVFIVFIVFECWSVFSGFYLSALFFGPIDQSNERNISR